MAHRSLQSAPCAVDGEPDLALSFRTWNRRYDQRFRDDGRTPLSPRVARLAGYRIRAWRMEHEEHAPVDHGQRDLPAVFRIPGGSGKSRRFQSVVMELPAATAGGRSNPRFGPCGSWTPQHEGWRTERLPRSPGGHDRAARRLEAFRGRRAQSP